MHLPRNIITHQRLKGYSLKWRFWCLANRALWLLLRIWRRQGCGLVLTLVNVSRPAISWIYPGSCVGHFRFSSARSTWKIWISLSLGIMSTFPIKFVLSGQSSPCKGKILINRGLCLYHCFGMTIWYENCKPLLVYDISVSLPIAKSGQLRKFIFHWVKSKAN